MIKRSERYARSPAIPFVWLISEWVSSEWLSGEAPNSAEKIERGSIHRLSQSHSPVTRPSTFRVDYTGIYSAKCTVSAEHLVGVIGPLERLGRYTAIPLNHLFYFLFS